MKLRSKRSNKNEKEGERDVNNDITNIDAP